MSYLLNRVQACCFSKQKHGIGELLIKADMLKKIFSVQKLKTTHSFSQNSSRDVDSFTYVIVGAGSAGCVLANRLTEDHDNTVKLLEAGPKDTLFHSKRLLWKIHMPAALTYNLCDERYNWYYHTTPQKHMDNRIMYWPRGRVWGGSSSLNAMVYIRGHAEDYNRWSKEGAVGWDYEFCLPYFKKAQTHELGADLYRGGNGPLHVSRGKTNNPLHHAFLDAAQQAGYPFTDDMNGFQQEGFGWMDMTIHQGQRWNTASAYLRPALSRPNMSAEENTLVTKILFEGTKAIGIEYVKDGEKRRVFANKEVILSAGAINSPQLLMLSGVGNASDLKKLGISVVCHLSGVGQNLQDHLEVYIQQKCTQPLTLYKAQKPLNMIKIGLEWLWKFTGDGATAHLETGGFIRSRAGVPHPDIQFHFLPSQVIDHGRTASQLEAYQVHIGPMRSTSVGWLKLKSSDPRDHPILEANYLSTETDIFEFRQCVKLAREIFAQKPFEQYRGPEIQPGSHVQSDEEIDAFIRQKADSAYHPSCTCKMGQSSDSTAVVDPQTKVIGTENLRVVDASIMPSIVSGNLNAPTIMVAEKAADIIKGLPSLQEKNVPVYKPKTVETQR
ncbi:choline dehydrogenase, mitochondrial [Sphaerodactylus townsendi]|uniref:choline dehydrogenase, mitochondrial n=1 Tax=Sphaerodactylus townsendi TaxID=933632 RepID=UPI002026BBBE|nr:choline dehydrogenase, mitochondrial [Sphaerodactylus townsendi]XP_048343620.1 choline dehydrogenase, mitochondrial [Sphaerodactylus townsendi]XP_048343621.1 choline dehydrogenase, mitochondrial [Sphaerodactylus townsendi]XP_048343622.1 choline dehydrogenase, mitochondrial [Sphaerodactylus townsendi]